MEDEEETIEEEEANEGAVDHQTELSTLAKEGRPRAPAQTLRGASSQHRAQVCERQGCPRALGSTPPAVLLAARGNSTRCLSRLCPHHAMTGPWTLHWSLLRLCPQHLCLS